MKHNMTDRNAVALSIWKSQTHLASMQFVARRGPLRRTLRVAVVALAGAAFAASAQRSAEPVSSSPPPLQLWVMQTGDNERAPFIIIDKRQARLWLFNDAGKLLGDTQVLLGRAQGDSSVPGIGEREMKNIRVHERTTPAGRFVAEAGRNQEGEDIFWIDYDAAVSMHRIRVSNPAEQRAQRLASPTATDNRISFGCVNVPAQFYDQRIRPVFTGRRGVVYVLPETVPAGVLFKPGRNLPGRP